MKKLIGFSVVLFVLFLSNSVFAEGFTFEVNGKKYEAAKQDLYGYYTFEGAKAACEGLVDPDDLNGDWSLPSKDELKSMYEQLHKKGLGDFAELDYWTSTDFNESLVWYQNFLIGLQYFKSKDSYLLVRCVRAF